MSVITHLHVSFLARMETFLQEQPLYLITSALITAGAAGGAVRYYRQTNYLGNRSSLLRQINNRTTYSLRVDDKPRSDLGPKNSPGS